MLYLIRLNLVGISCSINLLRGQRASRYFPYINQDMEKSKFDPKLAQTMKPKFYHRGFSKLFAYKILMRIR